MKFNLFNPPKFKPMKDDLFRYLPLNKGFLWKYASSGKAALYLCLKSHNIQGYVVVPSYACESVVRAVRYSGCFPVFCDIDVQDCNFSIESLEYSFKRYSPSAFIAISLYGLPADLVEAEGLCQKYSVKMIDDAAQSWGASINSRKIGTFGDAGLFAFSPGKATAGHCGALYWTSNIGFKVKQSNNIFAHRVIWEAFYRNRLNSYSDKTPFPIKFLLAKVAAYFTYKIRPFSGLCNFEKPLLCGILKTQLDGGFNFRIKWHKIFINKFQAIKGIRILDAKRGEAHPHKIVMIVEDEKKVKLIKRNLLINNVAFLGGYPPLSGNDNALFKTENILNHIIELPIESDDNKMQWLLDFTLSVVDKSN